MRSELDVVVVGQLELLTDVLPPGWVEGNHVGREVSAHNTFREVWSVEALTVVVAFHTSASALHILAVVQQHLVYLLVVLRNSLPVGNHCTPVKDGSQSEHLRKRVNPSVGLPADVAERVLNEAEEILESSAFVALVVGLLAESELFKFPVVLLSHGPDWHQGYL